MDSFRTSEPRPNVFINSLSEVCHRRLLDEKWLIGPTRRIVNQWSESVARSGVPAVNIHPKTLLNVAHEVAAPLILERGLAFPAALERMLLAESAWDQVREKFPSGYLTSLKPGVSLFRATLRTLTALRMAGLTAAELRDQAFEVAQKAHELRALLAAYESELGRGRYADTAEVYQLALARLTREPDSIPSGVCLLVPADLEVVGLERDFLDSIPGSARIQIPVDEEGVLPEGDQPPADSLLLRWARHPGTSPNPSGDGTIQFFEAVAEVNEVREILRRCQAESLPLDQVEVILPDLGYVTLAHEVAETLRVPAEGSSDREIPLPVTYADGIPVTFARPARALLAWLEWMDEGYPQSVLIQMIQDGLLETPKETEVFQSQLAEALKALSILHGRERYHDRIRREIERHKSKELETGAGLLDENGDPIPQRGYDSHKLAALETLQSIVEALLELSPYPNTTPGEWLERADRFLRSTAHAPTEFDRYTRREFLVQIESLKTLLLRDKLSTHLDIRDWLRSLARDTRLMGSAPKPGHLHVSTLQNGGHSGRPFTFVLGLDDARFPGGAGQDPLLLDGEREKLSKNIPTSVERQARQIDSVHRLLARLRGRVTLSCAVRDVVQDREQFPSPLFVSLRNRLLPAREPSSCAAFVPANSDSCLNESESWLYGFARTCKPTQARLLLKARHPHLEQGLVADSIRDSFDFTLYDGALSLHLSGIEKLDPVHPSGPALSASSLQVAGRCPLAYFYSKVLHLKPPLDRELDPATWLDAMAFGSVLHDILRAFYAHLIQAGEPPSLVRHAPFLEELTRKRLQRESFLVPPPSDDPFNDVVDRMLLAGRVFLAEEEEHFAESSAVYVEAAFGSRPEEEGTPIDTREPAQLDLGDGVLLRVKGRVDRIDRRLDGTFVIWDYKSGSSTKYKENDGFNQGRILQHFLYWPIVENRLGSTVSESGYIFPLGGSRGERVVHDANCQAEGRRILRRLVALLHTGSFPATNDRKDCEYCDFKRICRDTDRAARRGKDQLELSEDLRLNPFRRLRGLEEKHT